VITLIAMVFRPHGPLWLWLAALASRYVLLAEAARGVLVRAILMATVVSGWARDGPLADWLASIEHNSP